jgi:acyl carrier protein
MDSIEIVAFAEKIKTQYDEIDFTGWLTNMELDEIINLSMNDIVNFVSDALYLEKN